MMPRKPTGNMTPERQKIRDRASLLCGQRAASSVWASRTASSRMCVFPVDPREIGRRFCKGCSRWLTRRHWTTAKGNEENRCDDCMRVAWRKWNEAARARVVETIGNVPKGWGFM